MKEIVIKIHNERDIFENKYDGKTYANLLGLYECVELPKGHGRLIDADAFIEFLKHKEYGMIDYSDCVIDDITEDAPTIIEADKGE